MPAPAGQCYAAAMRHPLNRLEHWRASAPGRIGTEIAQFAGFAIRRFMRERGLQSASSLTYTTLLALVPLLAIAFSIFAAFPAFRNVRTQLEAVLFENLVPEVGGIVQQHMQAFLANASSLGTVGVVALALSAVLLLATIEGTLNRIWRVERPRPVLVRLLMFWAVLTLGPLLLGVSLTITTDAFSAAGKLLTASGLDAAPVDTRHYGIGRMIAALLQTAAFTALFMVVPNRPVALRDALVGGVVSGVGFELLKSGFAWYLTSFPTYQTIYGAMAVIPIFLIWLYLSWTVVLLGAVFAAAFPEWWQARTPSAAEPEATPAARLAAALTILSLLRDRLADGTPATVADLAGTAPAGELEGLLEKLRTARYVAAGDDASYVLSRDLSRVTVHRLYRDLGLSVLGQGEADPPDGRTGELVGRLAAAEAEALAGTVMDALPAAAGETT
jgi:membrane protein